MAYISFQPSDFFNTNLWTGTGAEQTITGVGFQPDFTWMKKRDGADNHALYDTARGATKRIMSNEPDNKSTIAHGLKSWTSDGFVVGTDAEGNADTKTYVGWNWKAGTTSVPSGGTITPSAVSLNTTSGISIIKYPGNITAGATIAHGLGAIPEVIIVKKLTATAAWRVYYQNASVGKGMYLTLSTSGSDTSDTTMWNDTEATSTLLYLGSNTDVNNTGTDYIAYCFTPIKGYSCFANFTGAGGTHPFMYCGFEPAFVMAKNAESNGKSWLVFDNKRPGYNETNKYMQANDNAVETTGNACDFTSQGFKVRVTTGALNAAGAPTFFMAFAAKPFVSSNSIPNTAR